MNDLAYYLGLPYKTVLWHEDGDWNAVILELPGCVAASDNQDETLRLIEEAKELWLTVNLEEGRPIPKPQPVPA